MSVCVCGGGITESYLWWDDGVFVQWTTGAFCVKHCSVLLVPQAVFSKCCRFDPGSVLAT